MRHPFQILLAWRNADTLAFLSIPPADSARPDASIRLFEGNFHSGFRTVSSTLFQKENPALNGLDWCDSHYLSFTGGVRSPALAVIDPETGLVTAQMTAPHRLNDLTCEGEWVWATTTRTSIIKIQPTDQQNNMEFPSPLTHPRGIAWDGELIWTSDDGIEGCPRLFRHDGNVQVISSYCPAYRDLQGSFQTIVIEYLAFHPDHTLWAIALNQESKRGIYKVLI